MILDGRRVLVARARPGRSQIGASLAALGAQVSEAPEVAVALPVDFAPLDGALADVAGFDALVFACGEGVDATLGRLLGRARDQSALAALPIVAVGDRAAEALRSHGRVADVVARGACKEALSEHPKLARGQLLVVAGEEARPRLRADLESLGATTTFVAAYRLERRMPNLRWEQFELVIAPSSSAARHLADGPQRAALCKLPWIAMGAHSQAAARALGAVDVTCADHDDVASIVAAAVARLARAA